MNDSVKQAQGPKTGKWPSGLYDAVLGRPLDGFFIVREVNLFYVGRDLVQSFMSWNEEWIKVNEVLDF